MYPRLMAPWRWPAIGMALLLLMLANPAMAASVFEEIQVEQEPGAMVVRIVFVAPIRYQSHTPAKRGNDLRILLRALSASDFDSDALYGRETRGWERKTAGPLRSLSYEGSRTTGSQLTLAFDQAVDFTVRSTPDLRTLVITIPMPKALSAAPQTPRPAPSIPAPAPAAPRPDVQVIQRKAEVVYLSSSLMPYDLDAVERLPEFAGHDLFVTRAQVRGQEWYRLTLGDFDSIDDAKAMVRRLRDRYPGAWVGSIQVATKVQAVRPRAIKRQAPAAGDRLSAMMQAGRDAMTTGEYANAVQLFTAILESPFNEYTQEAQELLGLARERNGQFAHAKAEYEEYLRHYPEGEDADRVRQRLAGVLTARPSEREIAAGEAAQEQPAAKKPAVWDWFGSLSQQYLRDETVVAEDAAAEQTNNSLFSTWFNLTGRRRGPDYDFRTQINLQHDHDLEAEVDPDQHSFSDLYAEVTQKSSRASLRFGRQRQNGTGTLGRFDGLTFTYPTSELVTLNAVWGHPVDLNDKGSVQNDISFLGVSANIVPSGSNWNYNAFLIQQEREGLLDRRAVGGEVRYFSPDKSLFTLVDYDTSYSELNIFLTQGNWNLSDRTSLYATLDYRLSPLLTTGNAIINQTIAGLPVTTLSELQGLYTEDEIRQFALDRSAPTSTITLGGSHRVREDLQINLDLTATRTDATPASGTSPATEATDTEYYYSLQFVANDYWTAGDTAIFGLRYGDATTSNQFSFNIDVRRPLSSQWRLNSRLLLDYRAQSNTEDTTLRIKPSVRAEYRGWKSGQLEFEMGLDWLREDDGTTTNDTTGYNFLMGYRWDF